MEINQNIVKVLKEFKIDKSKGILCLLAIYFDLEPESMIDEETIKAINLTKIVDVDFTRKRLLVWNMPLFKGEEHNFEWVRTEWLPMYAKINPARAGSSIEAIKKMQQFFAKFPQYRKEDVLKATQNYLSTIKNGEYLLGSNNFILTKDGAIEKSELLGWCEKLETTKGVQMKGKILNQ